MAFVPWKDRVTATPHRYKLTEVGADTYDLEAVPGAVSEAGTPVTAANMNRLIQRDGDDIKDTVVAFTEAGTRANIGTGESTATLFGKIKKYFTDLKTHAFTTPSSSQGTGTTTVPSDNLLKESSFARVYRSLVDLGLTAPVYMGDIISSMADGSVFVSNINIATDFFKYKDGEVTLPGNYGLLTIFMRGGRPRIEYSTALSGILNKNWYCDYVNIDALVRGWRERIDDSTAQTISGVKTYTASPIVPTTPSGPSAAVAKSYADGLSTPYSKVIRTQAEFEALIASATWLDAKSVAIVGQFTLSTANNIGIKIPATVKQIHGFNSAKITITNFAFDSGTAKGGLWYDTAPTTNDYSIRDLEVDCTGAYSYGFVNCTNLTNCTGTGTGTTVSHGFSYCTNLTNCTGKGTGTGAASYGFINCTNLTNCTGTGTGATNGYGFHTISYASNCKDGGSKTAMWGGTNKNIDIETCRKTPVEVTSGELTTLNT